MFGDKLRALREDRDLKQSDVAKVIGVSDRTIGMYEQGRREPDFKTLKKLADFYHVSIDYLLDDIEEKNPNSKRIYTKEEIIELLPPEYRKLFEKQNNRYIKFTNALMKNQIDIDKIIKLIEITEEVKIDLENNHNSK